MRASRHDPHPEAAEGYEISTDPRRIDGERVHRRLSTDAYWALGRPRERQDRAIEGSLDFGVCDALPGEQHGVYEKVGFTALEWPGAWMALTFGP
ncbi:hypothetical protein OIE75_07210 [Streptomyces sp. NBC_01723]|uniref:hypothetical protein n=1 Tax=Streptomyces sp. NBC_01723 TaxID=2975921 RepID=UPI002E37D2C2|nr:hypothetical protein [Streptomyces sp. NBC_01723]